MGLRQELVEIEKEFWEAPPDGSIYNERMVADGRILMPSPGGTMDRDETVEAVEGSKPWTSYEFLDLKCHELGDDAGLLTYRTCAHRDGMSEPYEALITSVYRKEGGFWKLVTHQQTPLNADG
ncbi:MAG: DUF4440 domain-containing protein [bacterium]